MDEKLLNKALVIKNYILEPINEHHAELLFNELQAQELYDYIPQSPPESITTLKRRYLKWSARKSPIGDEYWLNYAIFDIDLSDYVGTVQATLQSKGKNYIAYEVFPKYQRRKVGTNAVKCLIAFMQSSFNIAVVTAHVDTRNEKSYKFLESLGFDRKSIIHDADFFNNSSSDEYVYELVI